MAEKRYGKKPDVWKDLDGNQITFFKVPIEFALWQNGLSRSAVAIYMFFMNKVNRISSLSIPASNETIRFETGIKDVNTVVDAIRELVENGWINDITYQMNQPNIYDINIKKNVNKQLMEKLETMYAKRIKARRKREPSIKSEGKFSKSE